MSHRLAGRHGCHIIRNLVGRSLHHVDDNRIRISISDIILLFIVIITVIFTTAAVVAAANALDTSGLQASDTIRSGNGTLSKNG